MTRRSLSAVPTALALVLLASCAPDRNSTGPDVLSRQQQASLSAAGITVNEVESNGGTPGDWVEFHNAGTTAVDLSGYKFLDNDNSHTPYVIPANTVVQPGGFLVLEEAQFGFGLGSSDDARLFAPDGTTLVVNYAWTSHATLTYGRCPDGTGAWATTTTSTKGAANICAAAVASVKINEVESNGGTPGDWVELYNTGATPVDLGGYKFLDNDNTHTPYVIPANTIVQPGGFLVLEEAQFGFGLGSADEARLFAPNGTTLVDSYAWTAHASTTYARCPDGTGAFQTATTSTKGTANSCGVSIVYSPWPGAQTITTGDAGGVFGGNMSGLFYQPLAGLPTGIVWAVKNGPGTLYRLTLVNGVWTPKAARTWTNGKALRYPNGTGDVDAEGVTVVGTNVYVAAERNNAANAVSRNSILRFSVATENGAVLVANLEWNLTADLPANGANLGLEAITRVPDSFLVAQGFFDESKGRAYNPADYPNNGGGVFFVGVEATGNVYGYALDHSNGTYTRVATFSSGYTAGIMDLTFDTELGHLWATCDNTCNGRSAVLKIVTQVASPLRGRFVVTQRFDRPTGMPDLNNEGFTYAPLAECVNGTRPALWADDGETGGFALRRGFITCSPF